MHSLGATDLPISLPGKVETRPSLHHPKNNLGLKKEGVTGRVDQNSRGSLHRASFQAQEQDRLLFEPTPLRQLAFEEGTEQTRSLAESNLPLQHALGGGTSQKLQEVPPPTQLRQAVSQLRAEIMTLQKVVRKLAELTQGELPPTLGKELADACAKHNDNKNKNNNNNTRDDNNNHHNNHTHNNNNNNNNNNKNSRESGLNSLDLDNDNPESEPDLDARSLGRFNPTLGVESSLRSLDQHEADLSFENLGHKTIVNLHRALVSQPQKQNQPPTL